MLCGQKNVTIIEAEAYPVRIHMLVSMPPSIGVATFIGFLKGKSSYIDMRTNLHNLSNAANNSFAVYNR